MLQLNTIIILYVSFSFSASFSCPIQRTLAQQDKFNVKNHHHDSTHSGKNMFKLILIEADFFIYHPILLSLFFLSLFFILSSFFHNLFFHYPFTNECELNKLKIINKNKIKIYSLARFISLYFTVAVFIYRIFYSYRFVSVFYQLKPSISRQYSMEFIGLHVQPFSTQI